MSEPKLVKDLHYDILKDLANLLSSDNDWKALANYLGLSLGVISLLEAEEYPALAVLQRWMSEDDEKSVSYLIAVLVRMERPDAVRHLKDHEFTVLPVPEEQEKSEEKDPPDDLLVFPVPEQHEQSDEKDLPDDLSVLPAPEQHKQNEENELPDDLLVLPVREQHEKSDQKILRSGQNSQSGLTQDKMDSSVTSLEEINEYEIYDEKDDPIYLEERKVIGKEGGVIVVEGTSVEVTVPENAIEGEQQEIEVTVYIGPPDDWRQLELDGHTIDLPQVQMSPSGTKFKRPVEVVTEISYFEEEEDLQCQYANGDLKSRKIWQDAIRAGSKETAKQSAVTEEPHVSFCIENQKMHAYFMHFTLTRSKRKTPKKKKLASSVYCDLSYLKTGCLKLLVVFYEQTTAGKRILQKHVNGFHETATKKEIIVKKNDLSLELDNIVGDWKLEQGAIKQVLFDYHFVHTLTTLTKAMVTPSGTKEDFLIYAYIY